MTTTNIYPDPSQITDYTSLLYHSSDSQHEYASGHDPTTVSDARYIPSLAIEGELPHDSGLKYRVRSIMSGAKVRKDSTKLGSPSFLSSQPLPLLQKEPLESHERILKLGYNPEQDTLSLRDEATPTTLSSSKGSYNLAMAITLVVFCLPFFLVVWYAIYLNNKPMD